MGLIILAIVFYPAFWLLLHLIEVALRRWRLNRERRK